MIKERWVKKQEAEPAPKSEPNSDAKILAGDYTFSMTHNGLLRFYKLHVPAKYDAAKPTPVLFALHGGGGDMGYQSDDKFYRQISKSDQEGFIAVFPNGHSKLKSGKFATWSAGACCGDARDQKVDDVSFIREIFNTLVKKLNVDRTKVFATGISNGGMMMYRLACEMSDIFKAVASVAGPDGMAACTPKSPISILHIHAKNDDHVLFNGGAGKNSFRDTTKVTEFTSVPATIAKWVKQNACEGTSRKVLEKPGASCQVYSKCKGGTEIELCVTDAGGHSWPGGVKPRSGQESPSTAISANDVMWDFFKSR